MAKKKSRKIRQQSSTKRRQGVPKKLEEQQPLPVAPTPAVIPEEPTAVIPSVSKKEVVPSSKNADDFAQDYFYIYSELRNILIITVIMFAALAGMSFMI